MKISAEFLNKTSTAMAIVPTLIASYASTLMTGPSTLIAPVIFGTLYYVTRNSLGHSTVDLNALERIEASEAIIDITEKMGFAETPAMYLEKDKTKFKARAAFNNVLMSENQLKHFDQEEQNFIWAHEFAHIRRGDNQATSAVYSNVCTNSFSFLALAGLSLTKEISAQNELLMASSSFAVAAVASSIPVFLKGTRTSNHRAEFDCDKRAALATGNIDAGIRALKKLNTRRNAERGTSTHPAMNLRIQALEILKSGENAHAEFVKSALKNKGNCVVLSSLTHA